MVARKTYAATTVLILFAALLTPSDVLGAYSIGFQSGGTWVNDITGKAVGDVVNVSVYFQSSGDDALTVDGAKGLIAMGLKGTFDPSLGDVTASAVNAAEFEKGPKTAIDNNAGNVTYVGSVDLDTRDPVAGNKGLAIWLGDYSYRIDNPGTNVFRFGDLDPSKPTVAEFAILDEAAGDIFELDPILFGTGLDFTYNLSITAVPEPSSMMLGLSALAFGALVWQRRKRS